MAADRDDRNPTRPLGVPDPGPAEDESAGPAKPDIRVSRHEDLGVEVRRDLTGGGRLARGDHTNMSRLSFSAKAKPRDWLDPELEALREAPAPETAAAATPAAATPAAAAPSPEPAQPPAPEPTTAPEPSSGSLLSRIGRLFGA